MRESVVSSRFGLLYLGMVALGIAVALTLAGCDGGHGPTLPSPDGTVVLESRTFSLMLDEQLIRGANLRDFRIEERLCGSEDPYSTAPGVRLHEDRDFQFGSGRANLAVAFDHSGSMDEGPGSKLEQARAAANALIDLKNANSTMAIVPFDETPEVTQGFTADPALLHAAVNAIPPGNGTAAWDAVLLSLQITSALQAPGQRAVVLMSDGRDNDSVGSLDGAIASARSANIPVFAIGFQTSGQANLDMRRLATETGGQFFEAATEEELAQVFSTILNIVEGGQYTIQWASNFDPGTNVEVRITYQNNVGPIVIPPACQVILGGDNPVNGFD